MGFGGFLGCFGEDFGVFFCIGIFFMCENIFCFNIFG